MTKRLLYTLPILVLLAAVGGMGTTFYLIGRPFVRTLLTNVRGTSAPVRLVVTPPPQETPEMRLCQQWMSLQNAGDPAAEKMMEPLPQVPVDPITEEQADCFNANYALHQPNVRIEAIRSLPGQRFLIVTKGSVSAPSLRVRSGAKVDSIQRALFNPSLVVEVRSGKIYPIHP